MSHDLVDLGSSKLDPQTNALLVQCKSAGVSAEDAPDYGEAPMACALGVIARNYPSDERGSAQAILATDVPGSDAFVVAARDTRTSDVYAELSPGDTALIGTGPDHKSQVRCQKRSISIVTEDSEGFNVLVTIDGVNDKIQITGFGHIFEMSKANGIALTEEGGAALLLKNGVATLKGGSINLGEGAKVPVHSGPGAGATSIPSLSVLVP